MEITADLRKQFLAAQANEITEYHVYRRIAAGVKDAANRRVLEQIAEDELEHSAKWSQYTGREAHPRRVMVWLYTLVSRLLGFTFAVKLMERGEEAAQVNYAEISKVIPAIESIRADEDAHEEKLLAMLDEERLRYAGSVVLGLNDALVELTGALAGLTLALGNVQLIALSGLVTGVAASMSMSASVYLSTRADESDKHPVRAAVYTGLAYVITVAMLILPYLLLRDAYLCLGISFATAVLIIAAFNYYVSVAKGENFRRRFAEMAILSFGVAGISFLIGYVMRQLLGVTI